MADILAKISYKRIILRIIESLLLVWLIKGFGVSGVFAENSSLINIDTFPIFIIFFTILIYFDFQNEKQKASARASKQEKQLSSEKSNSKNNASS